MDKRGELYTRYPMPEIVFGKSIISYKVTVRPQATLLVDNNTYQKAYMLKFTNPAVPVYIGNVGVTIESGFEVDSTKPMIFGMLENAKLYAIAPVDTEVLILDMGL